MEKELVVEAECETVHTIVYEGEEYITTKIFRRDASGLTYCGRLPIPIEDYEKFKNAYTILDKKDIELTKSEIEENDVIAFVQKFIKEHLEGNLDNLKDFSFWDIEGTEYDGNPKGKFDGDRTKIAYAIYFLYNPFMCPDYPFNVLGTLYSGDTIHTFNTLFGKTEKDRQKVKNLFAPDLQQKIDEFYRSYQKIGNFYVLPCKTLPNTNVSINSYRGRANGMKDYFDTFLTELDKCLKNEKDADETLSNLIKVNDFAYGSLNCAIWDCLKSFCRELLYCEYEAFPKFEKHFAHWEITENMSDAKKKEYVDFALDYIQKATELINKRYQHIVGTLKDYYPELKEKLTENC